MKYDDLFFHQILPHLTLACPQARLKRKQTLTKTKQLNFPTVTLKKKNHNNTISISNKFQINPVKILKTIQPYDTIL